MNQRLRGSKGNDAWIAFSRTYPNYISLNLSLDRVLTVDETYSTYIVFKLRGDDMLPRSIGPMFLAVEIYSSSHVNGPAITYLTATP